MLYAILVLRDCANRASLLTWNRNINDSVVWASSETLTAADTNLVVDLTLRCFWVELDSILRTSMLTSTSYTATTEVCDVVVGANT
jgi:hypothetical protein